MNLVRLVSERARAFESIAARTQKSFLPISVISLTTRWRIDFIFTLDRTNRNLPGGLTKSEMEDDPSRAKSARDIPGLEQGIIERSPGGQDKHSN
jgi:hypothetical protein